MRSRRCSACMSWLTQSRAAMFAARSVSGSTRLALGSAKDVGFDVHRTGEGDDGANARLGFVDGAGEAAHVETVAELDLGAHQELLRTKVLRTQMDQLYDVFAAANGIFDLAHVLTCRALADEQSLHLDRKHDGDDAQQDADAQRPD